MNKKKLALTLLLSSASVSVFAADAGTPAAPAVVTTNTPATPTVIHPAVVVDAGAAGTKIVTTTTTTPSPVVAGAPVIVPGAPVVAAGAPVAVVPATVGYFSSAWSAVKGNQVMTAALVTTCILLGAVVHAAVASNNEVDADDAE